MYLRAALGLFALLGISTGTLAEQGHFHLAAHYAPVIYQDVVCTEYGDFITRVNYDGDYVSNNNWNNLGYPNKARRLPAYVYYSVTETSTHYFITYGLFHPADDFHCNIASHENDLEGIVVTVRKDGTPFGALRMVQLQAHLDYYQYRPSSATGIVDRNEDIDGTIILDNTFHPRVYVEGGGHGIRHRDTGGAPSVIYSYRASAEDPDEAGYSSTGYDLLSIFSELWERRDNCCGSGNLFDDGGAYQGRRGFSVSNLGRKFDGNDGSQESDKARPPWNWKDNDDPWNEGDWFMDPAGYQNWQFQWSETFATDYLLNPFLRSHLPDEIYNGRNGVTILNHGPYEVVRTVSLSQGQTLTITPGRTVLFRKGQGIRSYGTTRIQGNPQMISLRRVDAQHVGVSNSGTIELRNGGMIRFP